jgi:hypothetical protein
VTPNTKIAATSVERDIGTPPVYLQDTVYYCAPASAQMLHKYYYNVKPSQDSIYQKMGGVAPNGIYPVDQLTYYKSSSGLNKPNSVLSTTDLTFNTAVSEINNYRPFRSGTTSHARVCRGYKQSGSAQYLRICDPFPTSLGLPYWEALGSESDRIYIRS